MASRWNAAQHDDPASVDVGYAAIRNALAHLGLVDEAPAAPVRPKVIHMSDLVICEAGRPVEGSWKTGDAIAAGQPIARRADGEVITAPRDGFAIFPASCRPCRTA
jgi:N-alpha-acetyl-L-2,4-diaminobutyrate deacetylase